MPAVRFFRVREMSSAGSEEAPAVSVISMRLWAACLVRMTSRLKAARNTERNAASATSRLTRLCVCILEQNSQGVGDPRQPCQCIVAVYGDGSQIVDGAAENAQQQEEHHPCRHGRRIGDMLLDNEGTDNRTQRQDKGQRAFIAPPAPAFHGRIQEKADGAGAQRIVLGNDSSPFRHRQRNHIDKQIFRP